MQNRFHSKKSWWWKQTSISRKKSEKESLKFHWGFLSRFACFFFIKVFLYFGKHSLLQLSRAGWAERQSASENSSKSPSWETLFSRVEKEWTYRAVVDCTSHIFSLIKLWTIVVRLAFSEHDSSHADDRLSGFIMFDSHRPLNSWHIYVFFGEFHSWVRLLFGVWVRAKRKAVNPASRIRLQIFHCLAFISRDN